MLNAGVACRDAKHLILNHSSVPAMAHSAQPDNDAYAIQRDATPRGPLQHSGPECTGLIALVGVDQMHEASCTAL